MGEEKNPRKLSPLTYSPIVVVINASTAVFPGNPVMLICAAIATTAWFGWAIPWVLFEDKEKVAMRKRQLRKQCIRELESDLGMEPMELWSDEDLDIVVIHIDGPKTMNSEENP